MSREAGWIPAAALQEIERLFEAGLHLRAYAASQPWGPLHRWRGPEGLVLAGRVAMSVGAPRLGRALHLVAGRRHPEDAWARYFRVRALWGARGPLHVWPLLSETDLPDAPRPARADWLALRATVLGQFRDFTSAQQVLERAEALAPGRPWIALERATLLDMQDRHGEALAVARDALGSSASYRPGITRVADLLLRLGRMTEAYELLLEGMDRLESDSVAAQLAAVEAELDRLEDAWRTLDRCEALMPLCDRLNRAWLALRRSDLAYRRGDPARAAALARQIRRPWAEALAARLEAAACAARLERRVLGVEFVQQHHTTCAPATLASLTRFFGRGVDHLALAEQIEYAGTPGHRERTWAEGSGWRVRELRVTWEAAKALLDRGLPFSLVTVGPTSAHEQAVVGYDAGLRHLILRDPSAPMLREVDADELLAAQAASGPRGLVLVPAERAGELEGLDLPDATTYDELYRLEAALAVHDRDAGERALAALRAVTGSDHALAARGRWHLAAYDGDPHGMLQAVEAQLRAHPGAPHLRLQRLGLLHDLGRLTEHRAELEAMAESPDAPPVAWVRLAEDLRADAREWERARALVDRALAVQPTDAETLATHAHLLWGQAERVRAAEAYRFAACLEDKHEAGFHSFFVAARHLGQEAQALALLRDRCTELGQRSGHPARTLFRALDDLDRTGEGFAVLDEALARRPDDGELLLFAADALGRYGEAGRAEELMLRARGRSRPGAWLRTAAGLAEYRGDLAEALGRWRDVLGEEPLALDAHRSVARLLSTLEGRSAAVQHLGGAATRFAHHLPLLRLHAEWLLLEDPAAAVDLLGRLACLDPAGGWVHRQRARAFEALGRGKEAIEEGTRALEAEPDDAQVLAAQAARLRGQDPAAARSLYARALTVSLDAPGALDGLVEATAPEERASVLAEIEARFASEVHDGAGLLAFARQSEGVRGLARTLTALEALVRARPEVWSAWSVLATKQREARSLEEAARTAEEAVARFPLVPRLWLQLADVREAQGDADGEVAAAEAAFRIAPAWALAVRRLADAHRRAGRLERSVALLERAVAREPFDPLHHGFVADDLWACGERERALTHLRQAVRLDPDYEWGWDTLRAWSAELGAGDPVPELARDLTRQRPGDRRAWLALARALDGEGHDEERGTALRRAVDLDPRDAEARDLLAVHLAFLGCHDEAEAVLEADVFGGLTPTPLRGRSAWVAAQRGDRREALARMQALLGHEPGYRWGWRRLVEWQRELGDDAAALASAESLVELEPGEAEAYVDRGRAREALGDRPGARADFTRAAETAPGDSHAVEQLLRLEIEDGRWAEADAVWGRVRSGEAARSPFVLARGLQVALHRGHGDEAEETFGRLARTPGADVDLLGPAVEGLAGAGRLERAADRALAGPGPLAVGLGPVLVLWATERGDDERAATVLARLRERTHATSETRRRALVTLVERLRVTGRGNAAVECASELTGAFPARADSWLALSDATPPEAPEACLSALARALEIEPRDVAAHDRRAWHLARAGRYVEALDACSPAAFGADVPLPLRGRAAWIEWRRGNRGPAIDAMEALVAGSPGYVWGLERLCEWRSEGDDAKAYLDAGERLVRAAPERALAHGYRAHALDRLGRAEEATSSLRRALELDPTYVFALDRLSQMALEQGRLAEAEELLRRFRAADGGGAVVARLVELRVRQDDIASARSDLLELCVADGRGGADDLLRALRAMSRSRWGRPEETLEVVWREGRAAEHLGEAWVGFLAERGQIGRAQRLAGRLLSDPRQRRATVVALLSALCQSRCRYRLLAFVLRHRTSLAADLHTWAKVGWALLELGWPRWTARWLASWQDRPGLEPWMLFNLAVALQAGARFEEAARVCEHALGLPPDAVTPRLRIMAAVEAAFAGQPSARDSLDALARGELGPHDRFRVEMGRAVAEAGRGASVSARRLVDEAARGCPSCRGSGSLASLLRRAVARVARDGGPAARWWAFTRE